MISKEPICAEDEAYYRLSYAFAVHALVSILYFSSCKVPYDIFNEALLLRCLFSLTYLLRKHYTFNTDKQYEVLFSVFVSRLPKSKCVSKKLLVIRYICQNLIIILTDIC